MRQIITILLCMLCSVSVFSQKNRGTSKHTKNNTEKELTAEQRAEQERERQAIANGLRAAEWTRKHFKYGDDIARRSSYGSMNSQGVLPINWNDTPYRDVAEGREKSIVNPFDEGRPRWSDISYNLYNADARAEIDRKEDIIIFIEGVVFWVIIISLLLILVLRLKKRTKNEDKSQNNAVIDNLKSAYDKNLISQEEYQKKTDAFYENQKEKIKKIDLEEKKSILEKLYKEGLLTKEEYNKKISELNTPNV